MRLSRRRLPREFRPWAAADRPGGRLMLAASRLCIIEVSGAVDGAEVQVMFDSFRFET